MYVIASINEYWAELWYARRTPDGEYTVATSLDQATLYTDYQEAKLDLPQFEKECSQLMKFTVVAYPRLEKESRCLLYQFWINSSDDHVSGFPLSYIVAAMSEGGARSRIYEDACFRGDSLSSQTGKFLNLVHDPLRLRCRVLAHTSTFTTTEIVMTSKHPPLATPHASLDPPMEEEEE